MSAPLISTLRRAMDALMVLTVNGGHRSFLKINDPKAYQQALDAIDDIQTALKVHDKPEETHMPNQPVEELPLSVQRYNCLLAMAADNARIGGDIGKAQVFATLALAEATALQVEP